VSTTIALDSENRWSRSIYVVDHLLTETFELGAKMPNGLANSRNFST
jgi:hypothetical protein